MKHIDPKPSHWDDDPEFPVEDWQYLVANGDTREGYRDWVDNQRGQQEEELADG